MKRRYKNAAVLALEGAGGRQRCQDRRDAGHQHAGRQQGGRDDGEGALEADLTHDGAFPGKGHHGSYRRKMVMSDLRPG